MNQIDVQLTKDRLQEIFYCGLLEHPNKNRADQLANEVETICGNLYESQHDWIIAQGDEYSGTGICAYDKYLFMMKAAILSALGFDRGEATDAYLRSNFEGGAHFAIGDLYRH